MIQGEMARTPDRWLSTRIVAARLGCSVDTVRILVAESLLPAQRHRGRILKIRESDLRKYMRAAPAAKTKE